MDPAFDGNKHLKFKVHMYDDFFLNEIKQKPFTNFENLIR